MRKLRVGLFLAVAAAASVGFVACGDDSNSDDETTDQTDADDTDDMVMIDAATPDAPIDAPPILIDAAPIDDTCADNLEPMTAPAELVLSGTVQSVDPLGGSENVAGATVDALDRANDAVLETTTSGNNGDFTITLDTNNAPVDGYARITATGFRRTVVFPPAALSASFEGLPAPVVSPDTFELIEGFAGVEQNDETNGAILVLASDCAGNPVNGATVAVTQNGAPVGTLLDLSELQPGAYAFLNVPAGVATVSATYNGETFLSHDVKAFAISKDAPNGTITATLIQPGYADL